MTSSSSESAKALEALAMRAETDPIAAIAERMEGIVEENNPEKSDKSLPLVAGNLNESKNKDKINEVEMDESLSLAPTEADEDEAWQNKQWDELDTEKEMRDAKRWMETSDVVLYTIVQIQQSQTVAVKKGTKKINWPTFVSLPNDLISGERPNIGDEVQVIKFS